MTEETASELAEAFREHRDAFGVPLTLNGSEVVAVVNESAFGRELMEGGFAEDADVQVKVLLADLAALPSIGAAASYNGRTFRVQRFAIQPGTLVGEYTLRPAKR